MNKRLIIIGITSVILVASGVGYWLWTQSPIYSLRQVSIAFKEHDRDSFEKYVDVEGITNGILDSLLKQSMSETNQSNNEWSQAGQAMATGFMELLKPKLSAYVKSVVLNTVEKGVNAKVEDNKDGAALKGLTDLFNNTAKNAEGSIEIKAIKKDGKIALVSMEVLQNKKRHLVIDLRMRERGNYWQIAEIANISELVSKLAQNKNHKKQTISWNVDGTPFQVTPPTLEDWINRKTEQKLRFSDFDALINPELKEDFVEEKRDDWEELCTKSTGYACRLVGYLNQVEKKPEEALKYYAIGCDKGADDLSCYNVLTSEKASKEQKAQVEKNARNLCQTGNLMFCNTVGDYLANNGKKDEAIPLYKKACDGGIKESCTRQATVNWDSSQKQSTPDVAQLETLCDGGFLEACWQVGFYYWNKGDDAQAEPRLKKSCESDEALGCNVLGMLRWVDRKTQRTVQKNLPSVMGDLSWGCSHLDARSCAMLGAIFLDLKKDELGEQMYTLACDYKNESICTELADRRSASSAPNKF